MRSVRSPGTREQAQSLVEFALIVPLFLIVALGIIDLSRMLFTYTSLSNGAREMVRVASISTNWSATAPITAFNNATVFAGGMNVATDTVTVTRYANTCALALDTTGSCTPAVPQTTCTLPLSTATCNLTSQQPARYGDVIEVSVTYRFQFNPLFQNRLTAVFETAIAPVATLTSTARGLVE
jgi:Flp pilus assembly protein TadG